MDETASSPAGASASPISMSLVDTVGFDLVGFELGQDIEFAVQMALHNGAVFPSASDPLLIFREAVAASIRDIESHPRGKIFQKFLLKGPYEAGGEIPTELVRERLSDTESAAAIAFIYSHMVNCFKGAVTELLAAAACSRLMKQLQRQGDLPADARLYVSEAVAIQRATGKGILKGADLHLLVEEHASRSPSGISVAGVAEVKSYIPAERRLRKQLDQHLQRAKLGLRVRNEEYPPQKIKMGVGDSQRVFRISVLPSDWKLPRSFHFEELEGGRFLLVDPGQPLGDEDSFAQVGDNEWRVTLRWSIEAIAEAAYAMTYWYMEKVGEVIYPAQLPKGWDEMTPAEAGQNAAKMMLYYAILRCRTRPEEQRAIALYNSYGFGYALGMNYKNSQGRREMLWPQDLDEILASGKTKSGCSIR